MARKARPVTTAIGFIAGFLTTLSFVPQMLRAWRTRSTADLSLTTIVVFAIGISLWIVYGSIIHSIPIVLWNVMTLVLNLGILAAKLRHG